MNSRRIIFLSVVLMVGCRDWGWQPVPTEDFEPQLNVMAVLSPDQGGVVKVEVMRTFPLEGPDYIWRSPDYVDWDDTLRWDEPSGIYAGHVSDATVTIFDGERGYRLVYDSTSAWEPAGRYYPAGPGFVPRPGVTYRLRVTTPDGLEITGRTTIPRWGGIIEEHTPDTLRATETIPVAWHQGTGFYLLEFEQVGDRGWVYLPGEIILDDTTYLNPPAYQPDEPDGWFERALIVISLATVDSNYYHYFITYPRESSEFTSIFLGEGDTGAAYGVDGGLGVFCSYRIDDIRRLILP